LAGSRVFLWRKSEVPWSKFLRFADPVASEAAFPYADVEIFPTSKVFGIEMTQVALGQLWLQRTHVSSPTISTATNNPGRRSIGFLTGSNSSSYHHC